MIPESGEQETVEEVSPNEIEEYRAQCDKYVVHADKQLDQLSERHKLSGQEFDKQIVALSGGGLALTITLAKDILAKNNGQLEWILFLCWVGFLLSLAVNLYSHRLASNHYNLMIDRLGHIREATSRYEAYKPDYVAPLNARIDKLTPKLDRYNTIAFVSCLGGILLFIIFITYNRYHPNDLRRNASVPSITNSRQRPNQRFTGNRTTHKPATTTATYTDSTSHSTAHSDSAKQHRSGAIDR